MKIVTEEELAEFLKTTPSIIRTAAHAGKIPTYWLGRKTRRYDLDAVLPALRGAEHEREETNESA